MLAVVALVDWLVVVVLKHFAHISTAVGFLVGLVVGLAVSFLLVIGWLAVRRSRSLTVKTSLSTVAVPVWRLVLSQFLPKPKAGQSLAMLPRVSDLPAGGWVIAMQCTSRMGFLGQRTSPITARARARRSVLAVRVFEKRGAKLWWTFRAFPAGNEEDALALVRSLKLVAPIATKVTAIPFERELDDIVIPGIESVWAYEREYTTTSSAGWTRILRGSVGTVVFEIHSGGSPDAASWLEIVHMAERFAGRIRSAQLNLGRAR
jgi:hypothetical protein